MRSHRGTDILLLDDSVQGNSVYHLKKKVKQILRNERSLEGLVKIEVNSIPITDHVYN